MNYRKDQLDQDEKKVSVANSNSPQNSIVGRNIVVGYTKRQSLHEREFATRGFPDLHQRTISKMAKRKRIADNTPLVSYQDHD